MKKFIVLLFFLFSMTSLSHAQPEIKFDHLSYNFSEIGQGEKIEHAFEFTNTGDQELVIEKVSGS